ncbi:3,4-dihydroxy 2-butanone 4-phosphate synthase [Tilletia horrida]|nr:3,4-dihydroxy 2-butanone 4-phosphate synthase [Tilletia horrida]
MSPVPQPYTNGEPSSSTSTSSSSSSMFDSVPDTIAAFERGEFVVILDDENRENEGDLIIAADRITTEQMAWLIKHSSGFVCISLHPSIIEYLRLPMMVPQNTDRHKTAYTITLDYKHGTTTGISAHDRALTSRKLARVGQLLSAQQQSGSGSTNSISSSAEGRTLAEAAVQAGVAQPDAEVVELCVQRPGVDEAAAAEEQVRPEDFSRPGHLNPLRYTLGGVQKRRGHTEASVDLCLASGRSPAALLCELVDPDSPQGNIAARDACLKFARTHDLRICSIEAMVQWLEQQPSALSSSSSSSSSSAAAAAAATSHTDKAQ